MKSIFKNHPDAAAIFLLSLLSLPAVWTLFYPEFFSTHDGMQHIIRFHKYFQAIFEGQFPVRWVNEISYNLGTPVMMFNGPLSYTLAIIPRIFGASLVQSVEIIFGLSLTLSAIFFYIWARELFGKVAGFVGALFYLYAPYRFADVYVRGAFPESISFLFPPLLLLSGYKIVVEKKKTWWIMLSSISLLGLLLSHNVMTLMFLPIYFLYSFFIILLQRKVKLKDLSGKDFVNSLLQMRMHFLSFLMALLLGAFYWAPAFLEKGFANLDKLNDSASYRANFTTLDKIFYSKWNWGPLRSESPMSPQLGIPQFLIIAFSLFGVFLLSFRKKIQSFIPRVVSSLLVEKVDQLKLFHLFFFLLLIPISFIFMTKSSAFLWDNLSLLSFFLYPWRFLGLALFSTAIIASFTIYIFKNNKLLIVLVVFLLLYANRNHTQLVGQMPGEDLYYISSTDPTDMWGEFLPTSADLDMIWRCKSEKCFYQKIVTSAAIYDKSVTERNDYLSFRYTTPSDAATTINTFNFPGWNIYIDGLKVNNISVNKRGTIDLVLPKGEHTVTMKFEDTPLRKIAETVSLTTFVIVLSILVWKRKSLF